MWKSSKDEKPLPAGSPSPAAIPLASPDMKKEFRPMEIKQPEIDAQLVAENVALQLERRVSFRRAMKKSVQVAMDFGAEGIKIRCAGRLGGAELARVEQYHWGRVPLHTLRANIDYGFAEAHTVYGKLGVKCWVCKGESQKAQKPEQRQPAEPVAA